MADCTVQLPYDNGGLWCRYRMTQWRTVWCSYRMAQWQTMMQSLYCAESGFLTQSLCGAVTAWHSDYDAVIVWHRWWLYDTKSVWCSDRMTRWLTMMQWLYGTDDGFMAHAESVWCSDCMTQWMNIWCSDVRTLSNCGCNLNDAGYCASHVVQSYIVWCDGCSCESQ